MLEVFNHNKTRRVLRESLERQKITIKTDLDQATGKKISYPYIVLPIHSVRDSIQAGYSALVCLTDELFSVGDETRAIFPEAKAWQYKFPFSLITGITASDSIKKNLNVPGQTEMVCSNAYRGDTCFFDPFTQDLKGTDILLVDDTISSGETQEGLRKSYIEAGANVLGGISVYERGDGVEMLNSRFGPEETYAGYARMEILPRNRVAEEELRNEFGDMDPAGFADAYVKDRAERELPVQQCFSELNYKFRPRVTRFYWD